MKGEDISEIDVVRGALRWLLCRHVGKSTLHCAQVVEQLLLIAIDHGSRDHSIEQAEWAQAHEEGDLKVPAPSDLASQGSTTSQL